MKADLGIFGSQAIRSDASMFIQLECFFKIPWHLGWVDEYNHKPHC